MGFAELWWCAAKKYGNGDVIMLSGSRSRIASTGVIYYHITIVVVRRRRRRQTLQCTNLDARGASMELYVVFRNLRGEGSAVVYWHPRGEWTRRRFDECDGGKLG